MFVVVFVRKVVGKTEASDGGGDGEVVAGRGGSRGGEEENGGEEKRLRCHWPELGCLLPCLKARRG